MRNTHEIHNYFHINTLKTHLICNIFIQVPKPTQVEDFNEDDYITEEEIEEVVASSQVFLLEVQNNKRKINDEKVVVKKQKLNLISLDTKNSIIDLNIQDEISLRISGKCTLNFD
ncbi:hypothetical protein F8M41_002562 [Gigaspora margarita]|uniref:Uncharacterized protein n=1 Tax=Gigaspora margarita TaxID=4874 RepID=A0A8H4ES79_GIGMA|nr:hypothetical protein F8M41_002562 [Gigaspora margarita]